jgi:hypothetical protein
MAKTMNFVFFVQYLLLLFSFMGTVSNSAAEIATSDTSDRLHSEQWSFESTHLDKETADNNDIESNENERHRRSAASSVVNRPSHHTTKQAKQHVSQAHQHQPTLHVSKTAPEHQQQSIQQNPSFQSNNQYVIVGNPGENPNSLPNSSPNPQNAQT